MKRACIFLIVMVCLSLPAFTASTLEASAAPNLLTLNSSFVIAMEKSPSIIAAKENVKAADGKLGQAFAAVLPNISLSGKYGSSYAQPATMVIPAIPPLLPKQMVADVGTTEVATQSSYNLTLSQPLYSGGRLMAGLDIAKANYEISKENLRKAEFDLDYSVVNSYYGVLRTKKLYELAQDSLDMAQSHLKQVNAMYSAGTATKADVLRAEVQVAKMELALKKADNAYALAKDAFNNVLGRDLDAPALLSEKEIVNEMVKPRSYSECLAIVFDANPDWKVFQLTKKISEKSVGIQFANYFPMISLVGSTGNSKVNYPEYAGNSDVNSWSIMASGTWNIFDGLATPSRVKESQANLDALKANEEPTRNGIMLDVKDACLNLSSAIDVIDSAKKAVESAQENYNISKEKYRNGIESNLEMIDAQTELTETKTDLYQAQFDYQIAKAKVNKAVGKEIYSFSASVADQAKK